MLLYVTCLVAWRIWETTKREGGAAFTADHKSNSKLLASFFFGIQILWYHHYAEWREDLIALWLAH